MKHPSHLPASARVPLTAADRGSSLQHLSAGLVPTWPCPLQWHPRRGELQCWGSKYQPTVFLHTWGHALGPAKSSQGPTPLEHRSGHTQAAAPHPPSPLLTLRGPPECQAPPRPPTKAWFWVSCSPLPPV